MKGTLRNKPCKCGSGIKTKKCLPYHPLPLYHITPTDNVEKIKYSGGLIGSNPKTKTLGTPKEDSEGFLYTTFINNKNLWDEIRNNQIFTSTEQIQNWNCTDLPYSVFKIDYGYLKKQGFKMYDDLCGERTQKYHIKIDLGDKMIPLDQVKFIGDFKTGGNNVEYGFDDKGRPMNGY